jgi:hypothetical protein
VRARGTQPVLSCLDQWRGTHSLTRHSAHSVTTCGTQLVVLSCLSLSLSLSLHTTRSYSLATPWSMRRLTLFSLSCHLRFAPHVAGFHTTFPGVRTCHFTSPSSYTTKEPPSLLCPVDAHAGLRVEGRGAEQGADQGRSAAEARQPRPSLFGSVLQTNLG